MSRNNILNLATFLENRNYPRTIYKSPTSYDKAMRSILVSMFISEILSYLTLAERTYYYII